MPTPIPPRRSPGPVFVVIEYHSPFAPHRMVIPLRDEFIDTGVDLGDITPWSGASAIDIKTMIVGLLDLDKIFLNSDCGFDIATLYLQPDAEAPAQPHLATTLGIAGTSVGTAWDKGTQMTLSLRDTGFHTFKHVLLDLQTGGTYPKQTIVDIAPNTQDVVDYLISDDNAFASRWGLQPQYFTQASFTLNEKLRREYRLT